MRHFRKHNGGFTLVELVVSIAVASIVTAAATSVLLLALRVNRQSSDTASQQNTVRALLTTMENAAADGNIKGLISNFDSWQLVGEEVDDEQRAPIIFEYVSKDQTIYANGTAVLEKVFASHATLEKDLLTISVETAEGSFSSSIWCRLDITSAGDVSDGNTAPIVPDEPELQPDPGDGTIQKFLSVLKSQYGSRGEIIYYDDPQHDGTPGEPTLGDFVKYTYYSEWYIQEPYTNGIGPNGWNSKTPWCACFVSWALAEAGIAPPSEHPRWFAEVDDFLAYFQENNGWKLSKYYATKDVPTADADNPEPGNLIFFDWIKADGKLDAQHVGVVLSVDDENVYTIEGNSAGRVAIRSYSINDERILGYGVLK